MQSNINSNWLRLCFAALATMIISLSVPAFAKGDVLVSGKSLAIKGYDPVSYFVSSKAQKGVKEFSHVHAGNTWMFANAANKNAFIANPVSYLPQYGGHCAYAASRNTVAPSDPKAWTVRDNKLYLNFSKTVRSTWLPGIKQNIVKSDRNWPSLAKKVRTR